MKKIITYVLLMTALLLALAGCSRAVKYSKEQAMQIVSEEVGQDSGKIDFKRAEEQTNERFVVYKEVQYILGFLLDGIEYTYYVSAKTGEIIYKSFEIAPLASDSDGRHYVGLTAAKAAALNHGGYAANEVVYIRTKLTQDFYAIGYVKGRTRYFFEIDTSSAAVTKAYTEDVFFISLANDNTQEYIGIDKAKYYAVKHINLDLAGVIFTDYDMDMYNLTAVYVIAFSAGDKSYLARINAATGGIEYHAES